MVQQENPSKHGWNGKKSQRVERNCRNVEKKSASYDTLARYYGNRKGAGNPNFFPHRTVR